MGAERLPLHTGSKDRRAAKTDREAGLEVLDEGTELDAVRALLQQDVHALERRLRTLESGILR